jgi:hypothetical protein
MYSSHERRLQNFVAAIGASTLCLIAPPVTRAQPAGSPDDMVTSDGAGVTPAVGKGVQGRVTFASGKPAANIFVQARSIGQPSVALPDIGILTNKAGDFFWPLPPGRFELTFILHGRKLATRQVNVGRSRATRFDIQLPARN